MPIVYMDTLYTNKKCYNLRRELSIVVTITPRPPPVADKRDATMYTVCNRLLV